MAATRTAPRLFLRTALLSVVLLLCSVSAVAQPVSPTATPSPSPTASEKVTPPEAAPVAKAPRPLGQPITPPLSLDECMKLIARARELTPATDASQTSPENTATIGNMVRASYEYLRFRDDLHTSLARYVWLKLDSEYVQNGIGEVDKDVMAFDPPVERISALSIEAVNADTLLYSIRVYDEKKALRTTFDYTKDPKTLRHSLPRRDVFHLWRRTTISRIEIEYSRLPGVDKSVRPRVVVYGGITDPPEHIKTAIYYLEETPELLQEKKWEDVREYLGKANDRIKDHIRKNSPG
ncbi:hypothetical protein BH09SUM1_BH09SUM1_03140 [soil metagenome]